MTQLLAYSIQDRLEHGEIGRLEDLLVEPNHRSIDSLVMSVGAWKVSKRLVVSIQHVDRVDLSSRRIFLKSEQFHEEIETFSYPLETLVGFRLFYEDEFLGIVRDFLIDDKNWTLLQAAVSPTRWWNRPIRFVSWEGVSSIDWSERVIRMSEMRIVPVLPAIEDKKTGFAA